MFIARKKHTTVKQFFDSLTDTEKERFNITFNNETLVSSSTIIGTFIILFSSFEFVHSDNIMYTWDIFKASNSTNFKRMYDALTAEYVPINNYDKTSTITVVGSGSSTSANELTNKETTEDSSIFHDTSFTSGNNTTTANNTNTTTERTTGNIGVTTNMTMITEEIKGRTTMNLANIIVNMYAELELI